VQLPLPFACLNRQTIPTGRDAKGSWGT
jgi:hypothetical protein